MLDSELYKFWFRISKALPGGVQINFTFPPSKARAMLCSDALKVWLWISITSCTLLTGGAVTDKFVIEEKEDYTRVSVLWTGCSIRESTFLNPSCIICAKISPKFEISLWVAVDTAARRAWIDKLATSLAKRLNLWLISIAEWGIFLIDDSRLLIFFCSLWKTQNSISSNLNSLLLRLQARAQSLKRRLINKTWSIRIRLGSFRWDKHPHVTPRIDRTVQWIRLTLGHQASPESRLGCTSVRHLKNISQ